MENTVYHDYIQGIKQLDLMREVRFSDFKRHTILDTLGISSGMTVVDLGCGPGGLTRFRVSYRINKEITGQQNKCHSSRKSLIPSLHHLK